jgi:chromosome segregation protein
MAYIKRMVMHGFKSFAQKTEIVFDKGINVVLGPNGSGKSNVSDALCFVLGRLSIKSMRAAKAKNLIFMGSKYIKPMKEASVEMVFDNKDRAFSMDSDEVTIKRAVRINGQSMYKINGENKTRAEIIEMLAQAGIDPHGYNLILQGQIQSIVKMHPEDRRKIIEEVSGISVYESRKEKSLHELDKTEGKLKEINAILREKNAYLRNLENEKQQAQKFKELELTVKRCKASLISRKIDDKKKEIESVLKSIEEKNKEKNKIKEKAQSLQEEINKLSEKAQQINKTIQQATGIEQETLRTGIANLKAEVEGIKVRKEGYENRKESVSRRIQEIENSIPSLETELVELRKESPLLAKKAEELRKKKIELSRIEEERKRVFTLRNELNSQRERIKDRERQLSRINGESNSLLRQLEEFSAKLVYPDSKTCVKEIEKFREALDERKDALIKLQLDELQCERIVGIAESEIKRADEIKGKVQDIDICPLCQSKITEEHKGHVFSESNSRINSAEKQRNDAQDKLHFIKREKDKMQGEIKIIESKLKNTEDEQSKHHAIKDKQEQLKKMVNDEKMLGDEIRSLEEKCRGLELKTADISNLEIQYDTKISEIEEISSRTKEDTNTTILYKERDLESIKNIIKVSKKDLVELNNSIRDLSEQFENKTKALSDKEKQEQEMNEKFKRLFDERDKIQIDVQEKGFGLSEAQNMVRAEEDQINYLRVGQARLDAEREGMEVEFSEYGGVELIKASIAIIEERLQKSQTALIQIGSINLRALEVYEEVKKGYDEVQEKVNVLEKEKQDILLIIEEIDKKKKREFMKTFNALNDLFSQNFSKLSNKGIAFLEIENTEDIFAGGVNIVVKLAKGKYFDVTSLSGGEQTLVALSLLFAIQEHKPYHFYVFDEIDAALDKRNSERLAGLLHQYMKSGQYIVITHNDAIIMNSNVLYGVSMHDGVSKILSLNLGDDIKAYVEPEKKDETKGEVKTEISVNAEDTKEVKAN